MIEIFTIKLSEVQNEEDYLFRCTDKLHRDRAMRFRQKDDRLRCLAAGYLMKHYIPDFSEELISIGKQGKPTLINAVAFNISHAGDYVVLAVCNEVSGVGVDVEPVGEMDCYRDILSYAMTEKEVQFIGEDAHKAVCIWTRKESLYKCVGEGIEDFAELPEVTNEQVLFSGHLCRIRSWESDGHMFSVAWRSIGVPTAQSIKNIAVTIEGASIERIKSKSRSV